MGRRLEIAKYQILADQDTTTNPESEPTDVSQCDNILYQLKVDSTVDGSVEVLFCNDRVLQTWSVFEPLDFGAPLTVVGSSDTDYMIEMNLKGIKFLKLKFTDNSGTGNISAWITGNSIGA
jgi:hypothetical protein